MLKTALLLSGGIDSMVCVALLHKAEHQVEAIHIDYGQAAAKQEHIAVKGIVEAFGIPLHLLKIELGKRFDTGEVPFRNAALLFSAAMSVQPSITSIAIGIHAGTPYPDCSNVFVSAVDTTFAASSNEGLVLVTPIKTWRKEEILAFAVQESLPLHLTYSCEAGTTQPCGRCQSCKDRSCLPI